jgi:hypothetical protein
MGVYTSATSFILDKLWDEVEGFADYFHVHGASLRDLGHLVDEVFVSAYLSLKSGLDQEDLAMLESQIAADVLAPLMHKQGFRELWSEWDHATRESFVADQIELHLGRLLFEVYAAQFAKAYVRAYETYLARR